MKIVTKILLLVVISVSIIMGSVSQLISNRMQANMDAQVDRELSTNLDFIARGIDLIAEDIRRTGEIIGHNRGIGKALHLGVGRGIGQILNDLIRVYPFLNYVLIVEPSGDIFASSTRGKDGRKLDGEQLLGLNIMNNTMVQKDIGLAKKIRELSAHSKQISYSQPATDPYLEIIGTETGKTQWFITPVHLRGKLIGMVVLSYDWQSEMSTLLKNTTRQLVETGNPTTGTLLVDENNLILTSDNLTRSGEFNPNPNTLWKSRSIITGGNQMDLIIVNDRSSTYKPLIDTRNLLLLFVLVGSVALMFILYYLLHQTLSQRLAKLHEGTVRLGSGKLSNRMPELGKDEIGNLATSFNRMAEWLESTTVSRDYIDDILESISDSIVTFDEKGLITTYNTATSKMFGYEGTSLVGQNVSILLAPEERKETNIFSINSRSIDNSREKQGCRKDGSLFTMDFVTIPLAVEDSLGFVGCMRDISIRKIIEQHMEKQSVELKRANTELERFVYVASHDLKAPMRGIDNLTTWIEQDLEGKLEDETQENLTLLRNRVHRMEDLLDGLLEYSRVGRTETKAESIDTRELVTDIVDFLALPDGFSVKMPDLMPVLTTEKVSLEQVMRNLINNAVKHHDCDKGCITVSGTGNNGAYEFSVSDDGVGIGPEFHERVFTMFQTLKPRDEVEGSGMGLALVKKEVELYGGTIRIRSNTETRGTTFHFTWKGSSALLADENSMQGKP